MRKVDFQQTLREILAEDHPLSYSQLQGLSNPLPGELEIFRQVWPAAAVERRREISRAMAQVHEDSPDMNFRDLLLLCLDDPDEAVRIAAIEGLGDDESFNLLERLLHLVSADSSEAMNVQAVLSLGRFAYLIETTDVLGSYRQRLQQVLLDILDDLSRPLELRRRALESVAYLSSSPEVKQAIDWACQSAERELRVSAIHAMGHHMAEHWRPFVERELNSDDPEMRFEAAYACGEMACPEMVHCLAPLLDDEDHEVVCAALWALGEIGGPRARRLLSRCLEREEEDIRAAAEEALHTLQFFEDPMSLL